MAFKYAKIRAQCEPLLFGLRTIGAPKCGIALTIIGVLIGSCDYLLQLGEFGLTSTSEVIQPFGLVGSTSQQS